MKRLLRNFFLSLISLGTVACSNSIPEIFSGNSLRGLSLSPSSRTSLNLLTPFTISGVCPSSLIDFEVSLDEGKTWRSLASVSSAVEINCGTSQSFSFLMAPESSSWPAFFSSTSLNLGDKYEIWLRGLSENRFFDAIKFTVVYGSPAKNSNVQTIGSQTMSGGGYQLRASAGSVPQGTTLTGGGFVLKGKVGY